MELIPIEDLPKICASDMLDRTRYGYLYKLSGIYFLFDSNQKLIYIGRAKSLRGRLLDHISRCDEIRGFHQTQASKFPKGLVQFVSFIITSDLSLEISYIQIYRPPYNWTFNHKNFIPAFNYSRKIYTDPENCQCLFCLADNRSVFLSITRKLKRKRNIA